MRLPLRLLPLLCLLATGQAQTAGVPPISTRDRAQVCEHYRLYYESSKGVAPGWTGSVAEGIAGAVSALYLRATLRRINYFRAMAGLPGNVVFDPVNNARCQEAALMMAATGKVAHDPSRDWKFYTPAAALAAAHADLNLNQRGDQGPGAINRYMADPGPLNACVGHRRWLLNPVATVMGAGIVPANSPLHPGTNVTWITDGAPRLIPVDNDGTLPAAAPVVPAVSWPPRGFVPAEFVFDRWSFSLPGADFHRAQVQVVKEGCPLPVAQARPAYQSAADGSGVSLGANTLVWTLPGNVVSRTGDETYRVRIANVVVAGRPREFTYTVTSIDPAGRGGLDPAASQDGKRLAANVDGVR